MTKANIRARGLGHMIGAASVVFMASHITAPLHARSDMANSSNPDLPSTRQMETGDGSSVEKPDATERPRTGQPRRINRNQLQPEFAAYLPKRGLLAANGGFVSVARRVTVDFESGVLGAVQGERPGGLIRDLPDAEINKKLSTNHLSEIQSKALYLLSEDSTPQTVFTADSMGVLLIADEDVIYELMPAGPITEGVPAELHSRVFELAWAASDKIDSYDR